MPRASRLSVAPSNKTVPEPGARQTMLETAERLFAAEGVERVPLSRIVVESGQRNSSALHYHFGSRPEIVAHVINMRIPDVNARRHRYLDEIEAQGKATELREIIRATAAALSDTVREMEWGPRYAQIVAQANFTPDLCRMELIEHEHVSGIERTRVLIGRAIQHVGPAILDERMLWLDDAIVMTIGRLARGGREALAPNVISNLIDFCTSAMQAPVSRSSRGQRTESVKAAVRDSIVRAYD